MGLLLLCNSGFMFFATLISFIYQDGVGIYIAMAGLVTAFIGLCFMFFNKDHKKDLGKRDGYIVVTFGWIFYGF